MSHLDEGQLTSLLDGELPPEPRRAAEDHLASCVECRRLYEEIRGFSSEADALVAAVEPLRRPVAAPVASAPPNRDRATPRALPWRPFALAATLIAALGLGYFARDLDRPRTAGDISTTLADSGTASPGESDTPAPVVATPPPQPTAIAAPSAPQPSRQARRELETPEARRDVLGSRNNIADAEPAPPSAAGLAAAAPPPAPQPVAAAKQAAGAPVAGFRQVDMEEAVRTLGGTIRLLDGLRPQRVLSGPAYLVQGASADAPVIRVVYEDPPGRELWLDQQRLAVRERVGAAAEAPSLLPGDTVITPPARGMQSVHWMDQAGFRLALTGFLPADSLRGLMRRVE